MSITSVGGQSPYLHRMLTGNAAQHYLVHLLRQKLIESHSRIVVVSSGAVRGVTDTSMSAVPSRISLNQHRCPGLLEQQMTAESNTKYEAVYSGSKFIQLLGAQYWRRQLKGQCEVVAVSPGQHRLPFASWFHS